MHTHTIYILHEHSKSTKYWKLVPDVKVCIRVTDLSVNSNELSGVTFSPGG